MRWIRNHSTPPGVNIDDANRLRDAVADRGWSRCDSKGQGLQTSPFSSSALSKTPLVEKKHVPSFIGSCPCDHLHKFANVDSLCEYTMRTKRFSPKDSLRAGALLKNLLREMH